MSKLWSGVYLKRDDAIKEEMGDLFLLKKYHRRKSAVMHFLCWNVVGFSIKDMNTTKLMRGLIILQPWSFDCELYFSHPGNYRVNIFQHFSRKD